MNPKDNPDGYACPSCKQLLMSDHEAERLRQQLIEAQEENRQLEDWNKYTVKMFEASQRLASEMSQAANKEKERAEKAEAEAQSHLRKLHEVCESELKLTKENKRLKELIQNDGHTVDGEYILCLDCFDSGWNEDREGRSPCTCVSESEPYQLLEQENNRLREALEKIAIDRDTIPYSGKLTIPARIAEKALKEK